MALSLRSSAAFQQSLDGAFTAFKRSLSYWAYPKPFKNISGFFASRTMIKYALRAFAINPCLFLIASY
jgi:hypothetical protein